ncbi:MAG: hypothetical protein LBD01_02930 [Puniceicoccales bacterium]|jgi:hypothetical protein|nr:hypothetical protein [Puniceicoccales bacterium]
MRFFQVIRALVALCLLATNALAVVPTTLPDGAKDPRWTELGQAVSKQQPATACALAKAIADTALAAKDYDQALKAILFEAACTDEGKDEEQTLGFSQIRALRARLDSAPAPIQPMLAAALAKVWRNYCSAYHWRLSRRSQTGVSSDDFRTWDLSRVGNEIARLYALALSDVAALRGTSAETFHSTIAAEARQERLRPSLYDFVVHDAVDFFSTQGTRIRQTEDHFQPEANSPILGSLEEFLAWEPEAKAARFDASAPELTSVALLQELLRFHSAALKPSPDAANSFVSAQTLAAADLSRLIWASRMLSNAEGTPARLESALRAFIERWKDLPIAADAAAELGLILAGEHRYIRLYSKSLLRKQAYYDNNTANEPGNPFEAYKVAMLGIALQPKSPGAERCRKLIKALENPEITQISTESVWNAPWPNINITCKNIDGIHFRAVAAEWKDFLRPERNRPDRLNKAEIAALLKRKPDKAWRVSLPKTDYALQTHHMPAPSDLKPGFYLIIASTGEKFSQDSKKNALAITPVWVSELALVCEQKTEAASDGKPWSQKGFLVNARTGVPVPGATVEGWYLSASALRVAVKPTKTDAMGAFSLEMPAKAKGGLFLATDSNGQRIATHGEIHGEGHAGEPERTHLHVRFLTDRALYRPGQAIQFKAIVYSGNRTTKKASLLPGRKITVALDDPNNKEAGRVELYTNGYGSASGSFVVPAGRLTGPYVLHTKGIELGRTYVHVEEYKRPKFEVALNSPTGASKLGSTVSLSGVATAFTGTPIDGATVKWRVERKTFWPDWCWWGGAQRGRDIAHGTTTCAANGGFKIAFTAAPDKKETPQSEPYFFFSVFAEVTDSTGETRTAEKRIAIGYSSLKANIQTEKWQTADKAVSLKIEAKTLDDIPQTASGQLVVYALAQPAEVARPSKTHGHDDDIAHIREWETGEGVVTQRVDIGPSGKASTWVKLPAGAYRAVFTTQDSHGKLVSARRDIVVLEPEASRSTLRVPFTFTAETTDLQPGDTFNALWASGYDSARAHVTLSHQGRVLQKFWTDPTRTQQKISIPITEALRGGFAVEIWQVRDNRLYETRQLVNVKWKNKELNFAWERFNSKLVPGGRETWVLRVLPPEVPALFIPDAAKGLVAMPPEVAVALYDASLDAISSGEHQWYGLSDSLYYNEYMRFSAPAFTNYLDSASVSQPDEVSAPASFEDSFYRSYTGPWHWSDLPGVTHHRPFEVLAGGFAGGGGYASRKLMRMPANTAPMATMAGEPAANGVLAEMKKNTVSLDGVRARSDLSETNFFHPALIAGPDGTVRIEFTASEALTRWRFLAFAHDGQLRSGAFSDASIATAKNLMVQPLAPRFLREGDTLEFAVKLTNRTDKPQDGRVRLNFADALTLSPADSRLGNATPERSFQLAPQSSQSLSWRISIPDGQGWLTYKAVASTGADSDGEEAWLPILSRTQLVTESLTRLLRASASGGEVHASFDKLLASATPGAIARHEALTVQVTSNPAWHAVLALPYLMEYSFECSEQLFNRYYANKLAAHIAQNDPRIARVFQAWKNTPALKSPLFKNQELKSLLIEETPWVREAESETAQRHNIGILFDNNRLATESTATLQKLIDRKLPEGLWEWFPGTGPDKFTSTLIVAGFGKMRRMGIPVEHILIKNAIEALDAHWLDCYLKIKAKKDVPYPGDIATAHYLYARSFFHDIPPSEEAVAALAFFHDKIARGWADLPIHSQAHIAIALQRAVSSDAKPSPDSIPQLILRSLRERARRSPELGTYWPLANETYLWWNAPIETQALLIELFSEMGAPVEELNELQLWLLKQKQTQAWPTTKATADAIYAILLCGGSDKLASDSGATISLGGKALTPAQVEAGTGFFSKRIPGAQVSSDMGKISLSRHEKGISWGNVTWQYHQTVDKITAHETAALKISKSLWKRVNTPKGLVLVPIGKEAPKVGDTLVVRLIFRSDRAMEFVHLKDQRGSGLEPVETLSGYRWKNSLGYYESTRDTATHFFIRHLNPGVHVLEYSVRVQHRGHYQSGIAELQCMYAPEFNAHTASIPLTVE